MKLQEADGPIAAVIGPGFESPTREWVVAALLFGLMLVEGFREGGFWPGDAFVAVVASIVFLPAALIANPPDRRSAAVIASLLVLATWWLVRAATAGPVAAFLPLGASFVAFAAAFAAVRPLRGRAREVAALGVACLGATGAVVGFAGLVWRWYPMAMPAQGLWRLSSTLTYSDAAGLVLGVCLLLALGSDVYPWVTRVAMCLCAAGLLATQSRGAYVAFACAAAIVPWRRFLQFLVPLVSGAALGIAAIATSSDVGHVPWLGAVFAVAAAVAAVVRWDPLSVGFGLRARMAVGLALTACAAGVAALLRHELAVRAFAPSDQDRSVEWSAALHQWSGAPVLGVGPDRLLVFQAADGTYAHFVHNEYLQIAADCGIVGVVLLVVAAIAVIRVARRVDVLSSCATSGLLCCAVVGVLDFDWHLTFVGFLGGWCLGLASTGRKVQAERSSWCASSRQRATHPVGTTVTVMRRPQSGQKRGGSRARPHPGHAVVGRPQPVQ